MAMKNILILRIFSSVANLIYIIYGLFLGALPLIIGGTIVILIHGYHIRKLIQNNKINCKNH
jgi:O-antigen/teichoic acid export membrane protein